MLHRATQVLEDKIVEVPSNASATANATADGDVNATATNATTFKTIKVPRRKLLKVGRGDGCLLLSCAGHVQTFWTFFSSRLLAGPHCPGR